MCTNMYLSAKCAFGSMMTAHTYDQSLSSYVVFGVKFPHPTSLEVKCPTPGPQEGVKCRGIPPGRGDVNKYKLISAQCTQQNRGLPSE